MSGEVSLDQAKADIEEAFAGWHYLAQRQQGSAKSKAAHVRVTAFLAQCEANQAGRLSGATLEALIAELRSLLVAMKPGSRLDVFDGISAGYCVQCGNMMDDVCLCDGEEYHERDDPAFDKNNPAY